MPYGSLFKPKKPVVLNGAVGGAQGSALDLATAAKAFDGFGALGDKWKESGEEVLRRDLIPAGVEKIRRDTGLYSNTWNKWMEKEGKGLLVPGGRTNELLSLYNSKLQQGLEPKAAPGASAQDWVASIIPKRRPDLEDPAYKNALLTGLWLQGRAGHIADGMLPDDVSPERVGQHLKKAFSFDKAKAPPAAGGEEKLLFGTLLDQAKRFLPDEGRNAKLYHALADETRLFQPKGELVGYFGPGEKFQLVREGEKPVTKAQLSRGPKTAQQAQAGEASEQPVPQQSPKDRARKLPPGETPKASADALPVDGPSGEESQPKDAPKGQEQVPSDDKEYEGVWKLQKGSNGWSEYVLVDPQSGDPVKDSNGASITADPREFDDLPAELQTQSREMRGVWQIDQDYPGAKSAEVYAIMEDMLTVREMTQEEVVALKHRIDELVEIHGAEWTNVAGALKSGIRIAQTEPFRIPRLLSDEELVEHMEIASGVADIADGLAFASRATGIWGLSVSALLGAWLTNAGIAAGDVSAIYEERFQLLLKEWERRQEK